MFLALLSVSQQAKAAYITAPDWTINGLNIYNSLGGNVSIGTTSANYKLTVDGDVNFTGNLLNNGSAFIGSRWGLNGSSIYYNNGNVGVGTSSPMYKLDVLGNARIGTALINMGFGESSGNSVYFGSLTNHPLKFVVNTNEYMRISTGGSVGIGTTTPSSKLYLNGGNLTVNNGTIAVIDVKGGHIGGLNLTPTNDDHAVPLRYLKNNYDYWRFATPNKVYVASTTYNVGIGTTNPTSKLTVAGDTSISSGDLLVSGENDKKISLTHSVQDIFTASNNYILLGRDVGIGTIDWNANLSINGGITSSYLTGTSNRCLYVTPEGYISAKTTDCGSAESTGLWNHIATQNIQLGNYWLSGDGGNEGVFVKSDGNVGIGTSSPVLKLHVNGDVALPNAGKIRFDNGIGPYIGESSNGLAFYAGGSGSSQAISVDGNGKTRVGAAWFDSGLVGNVGIGTTTPSSKLYLNGGSLTVNNGPGVAIDVKGGLIGGLGSTPTQGDHAVPKSYVDNNFISTSSAISSTYWSLSSDKLYPLNNSWNIGIGTTTPAQKLDVLGVINASSGFRVNNAVATAGQYLRGNGTNFVASTIQVSDVPALNQNTTGYSSLLMSEDNRTVSPSDLAANRLKFGFTSYNNNTSSPWADFIHLRSYQDVTGGKDNLLVFNKVDFGMRLYQQAYGSSSGYSSYKDILLSDNSPAINYVTKYTSAGDTVSVGKSIIYDNGTNVGINTTTPATKLHVYGNGTYSAFFTNGRVGIGTTTPSTFLDIDGGPGVVLDLSGGLIGGLGSTPTQNDHAVPLGFLMNNFVSTTSSVTSAYWKLNGSNLYASTTDWNIGIGTTNPMTKLTTEGNISVPSGYGLYGFNNDRDIGLGELNINSAVGDYGGAKLGDVYIGSPRGSDAGGADVYLSGTGSNISGNVFVGGIDSDNFDSGNLLVYNRVGIGTTNPLSRLHIYDASSGPILTMSGLDTNYRGLKIGNTSNAEQWFTGNNASNNFVVRRSGTTDYLTIASSTGNVGIGTTSPSNGKLEINAGNGITGIRINGGTTSDTDLMRLVGNAATQRLILERKDSGVVTFLEAGTTIGLFGTETNHDLRIRTNYRDRVTINTSGNVGIGTTTPSSKLYLNGGNLTVNNGPGVAIDVKGGLIGGLGSTPTQGDHAVPKSYVDNNFISTSSAISSTYWSLSSDKLYPLNNSWNIGIGTTNPQAKLDILKSSAAMTFATTPDQLAVLGVSGSEAFNLTSSYIDLGSNPRIGGLFIANTTSNNMPNIGVVGIGSARGGNNLGNSYGGVFSAVSTLNSGVNNNYGVYVKNVSGGTNYGIYVEPVVNNYFAGNVGIGTTTPTQKLDVLGNIRSNGLVQSLQPGGNNFMFTMDALNGAGPRLQLGVLSNPSAYFEVGAWGGINNFDSKTRNLKLYTNGGFIYLNTSGRVGINTTTPSAPLTVAGETGDAINVSGGQIAGLNSTPFKNDHAVPLGYATTTFYMVSGNSFGGDRTIGLNDNFNLGIETNSITRMTVTNAGNVGIGTTAPSEKLYVAGNMTATGTVKGLAGLCIGSDCKTSWSQVGGAYWKLTGSNLYASTTDWNVGIGTTDPEASLHVYSGADSLIANFSNVYMPNGLKLGHDLYGGEYGLYDGATDDLIVGKANEDSDLVLLGQNVAYANNYTKRVGIGTTSPDSKLHIYDASSGPILTMSGLDTNYRGLKIGNTSNAEQWFTGNNASNNFVVRRSGTTDYLTIASSTGNVGIGTTNPGTAKLSIEYSDTDTILNTASYPLKIKNTAWSGSQITGIEFWNGSLKVVPTARIISQMNGSGSGGENLYFQTQSSSATNPNPNQPTTKLSILADGNIGIGISPQAKLHVQGNIATPHGVTFNHYESSWGSNAARPYLSKNWASTPGDYLYLGSTGNTSNSIQTAMLLTSSEGIKFGRGTDTVNGIFATEWMRINTSGNVGIGTTTPSRLLQVGPVSLGASSDTSANIVSSGGVIIADSRYLSFSNTYATHGRIRYYGSGANEAKLEINGYYGLNFLTRENTSSMVILGNNGFVGIGTTTPIVRLSVIPPVGGQDTISVNGGLIGGLDLTPINDDHAVSKSYVDNNFSSNDYWGLNNDDLYARSTNYNVGIGTTAPDPGYKLHVVGSAKISGGLDFGGTLTASAANITGKLTVQTIDPLYQIKGIKYSTFAPSFVGGVKEEISGRLKVAKKVGEEYQAVIDFTREKVGSDLWVWRRVIDFSADKVEALITPYGSFANVYYYISGESIVFRSDRPIDISYRLTGRRFDWRNWPTKATDQTEKPSFIVD